MDTKSREIIKSLARMAWADGQVTEEERALLLQVFVEAGASEQDTKEFGALLSNPETDDGDAQTLSDAVNDEEGRINVMRALLIMSFMDGVLSFAEMSHIEQTQKTLGISDDQMETLRSEALDAAKTIHPELTS